MAGMKIVFATMTAISLALLPVAASPLMGQYLAVDGTAPHPEATFTETSRPVAMVAKPTCDCATNPASYNYSKDYADVYSDACYQKNANDAYRSGMWNSVKYVCHNGSYWACQAFDGTTCDAYAPRPTCPQDSCVQ